MDNTLERPPEDRWPVLRVAFSWLGFVNNGVLVFYEYLGVCGWECGARDRLCRNIWLLLTWPIGSPVCVSYWLLITRFVYTPLEAWSLGYKTEVFGVLRGRSREARNEGQSTEREWSRDTRELNAYSLIDTSWVVAKCRRPSSSSSVGLYSHWIFRLRTVHDIVAADQNQSLHTIPFLQTPSPNHYSLIESLSPRRGTSSQQNSYPTEYFFTYFIVFRTEYCRYVGTDC